MSHEKDNGGESKPLQPITLPRRVTVTSNIFRGISQAIFDPALNRLAQDADAPAALPVREKMERMADELILQRIYVSDRPTKALQHMPRNLYPVKQEARRMLLDVERTEAIYQTAKELMYEKKTPPILPIPDEVRQLFMFLGFKNEQEFRKNILAGINEFCSLYGLDFRRFQEVFDFADFAYSQGKFPKRYSRESYVCHPLRMVWNYLSFLEERKDSITNQRDSIQNTMEVMLLHDLLEDLDFEETAPNYNSLSALQISPRYQSANQSSNYMLDVINHERTYSKKLILSDSNLRVLQALNRQKDHTLLTEILVTDKSGTAAVVKYFDKLDNTLTGWHYTRYVDAVRNMLEIITTMGAVGWQNTFRGDFNDVLNRIFKVAGGSEWKFIAAVPLLARMMSETYIACFKKELDEKLREKNITVDIDPANLRFLKQFKSSCKDAHDFMELTEELPWKRIYRRYNKSSGEDNFHPLSFRDLYDELRFAKSMMYDSFFFYIPYPGGLYDFWSRLDLTEATVYSLAESIPISVYSFLDKIRRRK